MNPHHVEPPDSRPSLGLRLALVLLLAMGLFRPTHSAPSPRGGLDKVRIHADYEAGDFDKVIRAAEAFLATGKACSQADSVFLEKHLAVVYAANPGTRERGRYHMLRMLDLHPKADLLDMFVGEEVDGIFEKVRKESAHKRAALARPPSARPKVSRAPAPRTTVTHFKAKASPPAAKPVPRPLPAYRPASKSEVPRLESWNLGGSESGPSSFGSWRLASTALTTAPSSTPAARPARPRQVAPPAPPVPAYSADEVESGSDAADPVGETDPAVSKPRWKDRDFWIGGGAAVAVVGLTVYFAGGQQWGEGEGKSKVYGVPANSAP